MSMDLLRVNYFKLKNRNYSAQVITAADYADNLALLANKTSSSRISRKRGIYKQIEKRIHAFKSRWCM